MSRPQQLPPSDRRLITPVDPKPDETLAVVKSLHDLRQRLNKLSRRLEQFDPVKTSQSHARERD